MTPDVSVRWDRVSFGLAVAAWVATCILFHTEWSFPFTPIAVAVPVGIAGLPLLIHHGRARRVTRVVAAVLLFAFCLLAILSAGSLFLPATLAMVVAVLNTSTRRVSPPSPPSEPTPS